MIRPKIRWGLVALVIAAIIAAGTLVYPRIIGFPTVVPSYHELKSSCDRLLAKDPSRSALDAWMSANDILPQYRMAPFDESFKGILTYNGLHAGNVNKAPYCTYFETRRVQSKFLSSHAVYGYFLFDTDGLLIDYNIHDIYYSM